MHHSLRDDAARDLCAALICHVIAGSLQRCEAIRREADAEGMGAGDVAAYHHGHGAALLRLSEHWSET